MELDLTTLLIGGGAVAGGLLVLANNRLATLRSRCERAEADVDAQLRHRHDLIPQLIELLRGYIRQENKLHAQFFDAYKTAVSAASREVRMDAENVISANLQAVLNDLSSMPEMKSSDHFNKLRVELLDVENKLLGARRFLNLAAAEYNAALDRFPGSILALLMGLKPYRYYSLGVERAMLEERPQFQI